MVYDRTRQQLGIGLLGARIGRVNRVILHHWTSHNPGANASLAAEISNMQWIHNFHRRRFGSGYGYSAHVWQSGRIFEGRGVHRSGAHTVGLNSSALAISVPGNTSQAAHRLTDAQIASIQRLIGWWIDQGAVTANPRISGHRDHSQQDCPGSDAYSKLHLFRGITGPVDPPTDPEPDPEPEPPEEEDEMAKYGPPLTVARADDPEGVRRTYLIRNWEGSFALVRGSDAIRTWTDRAERDDQPHVSLRSDWVYGWFAGMEQTADLT